MFHTTVKPNLIFGLVLIGVIASIISISEPNYPAPLVRKEIAASTLSVEHNSTQAHTRSASALTKSSYFRAASTMVAAPKVVTPIRVTRIAIVIPSFTNAAYSNGKFYKFYKRYESIVPGRNVTSDLRMLNASVAPNKHTSALAILRSLQRLGLAVPEAQMMVLDDTAVDSGGIFFGNGSNMFDAIILGHQEYVTAREYYNLKRFVSNGGTMILLDGNVFYAQVNYNPASKTIILVKGHGWAFNGKTAWKSVSERWAGETAQWVGSNFLCYLCVASFENNPFHYHPHEEQYLTNPKDVILFNYDATIMRIKIPNHSPVRIIATYELHYGSGKVIGLGIYSEDVLWNHRFIQFLNSLFLNYVVKLKP